MLVKEILKKIIPENLLYCYRKMRGISVGFKEEKKSFGNLNKDKVFYVIRRTPPAAGLFSNYGVALLHLLEAKKRNLIPIIDYETYYSDYQEDEIINQTHNAWEYYFKQPTHYNLKEIYQSKNVILSREIPNEAWIWGTDFLKNEKYIDELNVLSKEISFNRTTKEYLNKIYDEVIPKNKKILGVAIRGREYTEQKPKNHPIQPELEDIIKIIQEKYVEWECDYIFVTTEELETLNELKKIFKEKLLYVSRERYSYYNGGNLREQRFNRKNDRYLTGLEYASEIYILSKCNSIICASTSGVVVAFIFNGNNYENKYIFDLGYYK